MTTNYKNLETSDYLKWITKFLRIGDRNIHLYYTDEHPYVSSMKGLHGGTIPVKIKVKTLGKTYITYSLNFEKYKKEFTLFLSMSFSPDRIITSFNEGVEKLVWDTLKEDNRKELVNELHLKRKNNFSLKFKNITNK